MTAPAPGASPQAILTLLADLRRTREPHGAGIQRSHRARRRAALAVGALLVAALLAFNVLVWAGSLQLPGLAASPSAASPGPRVERARPKPAAASSVPPAVLESSVGASRSAPVAFRFSAVRGDCWVSIRAGGANGRVLYQGVLRRGGSAEVHGRRLWARFGAIGNLDLSLNGTPVHSSRTGTVDALITHSGIGR